MINYVYQLVSPQVFSVKYEDIAFEDKVIIRPKYMAVCHADQRYYQGKRDRKVLRKKLPMALIHECCGEVVYDPSDTFSRGEAVILIPNVPGEKKSGIYENYAKGAAFLSSGRDGFLQEYIALDPNRVVSAGTVSGNIQQSVSLSVWQFMLLADFRNFLMHAGTESESGVMEVLDLWLPVCFESFIRKVRSL